MFMSAVRQDAWSDDDDLLLAEVTLRHIREGSTQLTAFEEVGQRLGRTAAACGFRWNSLIRKKYESAIQIAKAQRQQLKSKGKREFPPFIHHDRVQERQSATNNLQSEFSMDMSEPTGLTTKSSFSQGMPTDTLTFDEVIRFLRKEKDNHKRLKQMDKQLRESEERLGLLEQENQDMRKELQSRQDVNEDYQALVKIMDRARKMAFLAEEETEDKLSFKMDKNGNLERVEKD